MDQLFNELYPITSKSAFIEGDINNLVDIFIEWQNPLIQKNKNSFQISTIKGSLSEALKKLVPLTTGERRRYLFIPTQNQWVAYFDNGHTGTDRTAPTVLGQKSNSKNIYFSFDNNTEETTFELYDKLQNEIKLIRSIAVLKESKWEFDQYGSPLPFEKTENYSTRQIKKRFNIDLLTEYMKSLEIDAFNQNYYQNDAILIEKVGPIFPSTKQLSLEEAQNFFQ